MIVTKHKISVKNMQLFMSCKCISKAPKMKTIITTTYYILINGCLLCLVFILGGLNKCLALVSESSALKSQALASRSKSSALKSQTSAPRSESSALKSESLALKSESLAPESESLAPRSESLLYHNKAPP